MPTPRHLFPCLLTIALLPTFAFAADATTKPGNQISGRAPSTTPAPAVIPAPDPIERPEFANKAKPLLKSITSVTAMMIQRNNDGELIGLTADIIATIPADSRRTKKTGIGFVRADGDDTMKTALEEALRAVMLRYPLWEPGHIDLSFGEKFIKHGGPSAGTAFAVLMLSLLEDFDIDPKCALTGDITVDWKVRKVGGVTAKVHGATVDQCLIAAIPDGNATSFADMAILYGPAALWDIQVFAIATLQDAVAVARKDRMPQLAEAITLFTDLQTRLNGDKAALMKPETKTTLKRILELAPNHLSAKYLLAINEGAAARTLSANATLYKIDVLLNPYARLLTSGKAVDRGTLPITMTMTARKRLMALRPIANKEIQPLLIDAAAYIEAMEQFVATNNKANFENLRRRGTALAARFKEITGPELAETLRREGY